MVDNILKTTNNSDNFINFINSCKTIQLICAINKSIENKKTYLYDIHNDSVIVLKETFVESIELIKKKI